MKSSETQSNEGQITKILILTYLICLNNFFDFRSSLGYNGTISTGEGFVSASGI